MSLEGLEYQDLLESIRFVYGYDFTEYAAASMKRRIDYFMSSRNIPTIDLVKHMILADERLFEEFIQEISVTVTEMFRDPVFYKSLREQVMKRLATYPFIKVWIAGCATGEEVYSVAIVLKEAGLLQRSVIYATDINQKSLVTAKDGLYHAQNMKLYTTNYQQSGGTGSFSEYYTSKYDSVLFDKSLRQNMVFAPHNLAIDKAFNEFQLILCRNVMIYFNQSLQNKVINLFYDSLCTFGFLGLGNKESLLFSDKQNNFNEINRREKIFIKIH
ncbi:MAG TPA: protein-glutamate O-methyltransferase CheR [Chryseosolibacter sp.]|jgi:Methylase of chemotaxis methyl-accepting proteins